MPDNPTMVPVAGWYTDPSDPTHERWWGGVEWTHDVRPLTPTVVAPPQQVFAQQPVFAEQPVFTAPSTPAASAYAAPSQFSAHSAIVAEPQQTPHAAQPVVAPAPTFSAPPQAPAEPAATLPSTFSSFTGQPEIAKPLSMADVPGGGINPFAAIDAQERQNADPFGGGFGALAPAPAFNGFDSYDPYAGGATPPSQGSGGLNASWYDPSRRPLPRSMPTNRMATAALVVSLVGANALAIVFAIFGLRKARQLEAEGDLPIGRKRARWGLGLGIASFIVTIAISLTLLFAWQFVYSYYLDQLASGSLQAAGTSEVGADDIEDAAAPEPVLEDDGRPAVYNRADVEQAFYDNFAAEGMEVTAMMCPNEVSMVVGGGFACSFSYNGLNHVLGITFTDATGGFDLLVDGKPVQN